MSDDELAKTQPEVDKPATELLLEQRAIGHAEGQQHAIADANAGLIDDLLQPLIERVRATTK